MKRSVMICEFPGSGSSVSQTNHWLHTLCMKLESDARVSKVFLWDKTDTPITMVRNLALLEAERQDADYVLMVDSDMHPDLPVEGAQPFFPTAFEFMLAHDGPCVVAAPYCGPPPREEVYIFDWIQVEPDAPDTRFALKMIDRSDAATRKGIREVGALATGLMLIDMRAVERLPHPRFYYEWTDETCSRKASTEDVTFTRDLTLLGVRLYCNWDAWAGHVKPKTVSKPTVIPASSIPQALRDAALGHARNGTLKTAPPPLRDDRIAPKDFGKPLSLCSREEVTAAFAEADRLARNGQPVS